MIDDNEFLENQNELYAFSNHETRLINTLNRRIQDLEAALREIMNDPRSNRDDLKSIFDIARKALDK